MLNRCRHVVNGNVSYQITLSMNKFSRELKVLTHWRNSAIVKSIYVREGTEYSIFFISFKFVLSTDYSVRIILIDLFKFDAVFFGAALDFCYQKFIFFSFYLINKQTKISFCFGLAFISWIHADINPLTINS